MARSPLRLSASSLAIFLECPRCFWLQINEKIRRPQGPFPSLPGGIDAVLKQYMDRYRTTGELPPELAGMVKGALFPDQEQLNQWRDPLRGNFRFTDPHLGIEVVGALDDLFVEEDGKLMPIDFKTRGWAVKNDTHRHYEHQLDLYAWLLEHLGHATSGRGLLLFFSPIAYEGKGTIRFRIEPVEQATNPTRAQQLIERAVAILRSPLPAKHADCAFCHFATTRAVEGASE